MDVHPVVPLAALLDLVHVRIPLPVFSSWWNWQRRSCPGASAVPMLQSMNARHRRRWGRSPAAVPAGLWAVPRAAQSVSMSSCQGTTASTSARIFPRLLRFWAVASSSPEKPGYLPAINPVLACDHRVILPRLGWGFQSFPNPYGTS